jgi:formylglycine-generating enzyme required for sulfatase activity
MKLFISYRRKSWAFTHRLADELRERLDAEIFVDLDGVDEADFERSILRHLTESSAVLLITTEETFADRIHRDDDWVRREIRLALERNLPIVLVCVEGRLPPPGLPEDIHDVARMQGVNFYPDFFTPAVERLVDFVVKIGAARLKPAALPTAPAAAQVATPTEKPATGKAALEEALDLLDGDDPAKAKFLLEQIRPGFQSKRINIDELIAEADAKLAELERRRSAALEYDEICLLAARRVTEKRGLAQFAQWQQDYPDLWEALDAQNIRLRVQPAPVLIRSRVPDLLPPPFAWCTVPAGKVTLVTEKGWAENYIPEGEARTFDVPAFAIGKYPITNAHFAKFIEAGGYRKRNWWTDAGWAEREKDKWTQPGFWTDAKWNGAEQPVVGVSWYEAVAFCRWLSEARGENVTLPTEQQWQRAAQGNDGRAYPWGNEWDAARCNTHESGIGQTTLVTRYEGRGDSPFGVVDMAGNVWEWCLTAYETGSDGLNGTDVRVLRGGSWGSSQDDARAVSRYWYLPGIRLNFGGFRVVRVGVPS